MNSNEIKVWDPLVRVFHWLLVLSFLVAYLTEDDLTQLHVIAGYTLLGALAVRFVWGLIGTRHARFSDFVFTPAKVFAYLKDLASFKAKRYLGHNPAGGAMILLMFVMLLLTSFSGLVVYGMEEHAGPLAGMVAGMPESYEDIVEEWHEGLANFTLFLVFLHVAGVLIESLLHRENLVRAMFNGRKRA